MNQYSPEKIKVLFLDDEENILETYKKVITNYPEDIFPLIQRRKNIDNKKTISLYSNEYIPLLAQNIKSAITLVESALKEGYSVPVGFVDMKLKNGESGLTAIHELRKINPGMMIAIVTAYTDYPLGRIAEEFNSPLEWLRIMKPETDYILKALKDLLKAYEFYHRESEYKIIGKSQAIMNLFGDILKSANSEMTTLIYGETGTGKELVARHIHNLSKRKEEPFIAVNCGSISKDIAESELFGHIKGSFTSAEHDRKGLFESAEGGTIFLDEIGELSKDLQVKLLRVLEERAVRRVGDNKDIPIDIMIICATNRNLEKEINKGNFRSDLYYRLSSCKINLIPLRERREDIPILLKYFVRNCNVKYGKSIDEIDGDTFEWFTNYSWPGNVRELKGMVENIISDIEGNIVYKKHLPISNKSRKLLFELNLPEIGGSWKELKRLGLAELEKRLIESFLWQAEGNVTKAAEIAGISRALFHRLMNGYGFKSKEFKNI
jgi:DNA-binding NtrC family response regulator